MSSCYTPCQVKRAKGLEPSTFSLESKRRSVEPTTGTRVTNAGSSPRTNPSPVDLPPRGDAVARAADALTALSPDERNQLALLLVQQQSSGKNT